MVEILRPNPRIPNLFRRDEAQRGGERSAFKINSTMDEALESMRAAVGQLNAAKFNR